MLSIPKFKDLFY